MLKYKTPMARKAAKNYCRRCLAVMVCCVLVFGLTVRTAPRAEAVAETALAGVGGGLSSNPIGASIALSAMLGCGVGSFVSGYANAGDGNIFYGTRGYEAGAACWDYLYGLGGDIYDWCVSTRAAYEDKGGVAPGDSFEIPAEVAEAIRQWTVTHFDFTDGLASYGDHVIPGVDNVFVLTDVDTSTLDAYTGSTNKRFDLPLNHVGSLLTPYVGNFSASYTHVTPIAYDIEYRTSYSLGDTGTSYSFNTYWNFSNGKLSSTTNAGASGTWNNYTDYDAMVTSLESYISSSLPAVLFKSGGRLYCGSYSISNNCIYATSNGYYTLSSDQTPVAMTTTITPSDTIDTPVTQAVTVTIPADLPTTTVGDYSIPVFTDLTAEDVLNPGADVPVTDTPAVGGITAGEITGAIEDALPVTGAVAGDQVVAEVAEDPDSLGDVFISKFPFSIPWDVAKAIGLLASPPSTPRWELDFLAPIADRVGGWNGDTTVVLDFSEYPIVGTVTRWLSTILFVYALALGTKRLIWTA